METVGKYRIVRQLGQGGMGAVFEGIDEKIKHRVAIKILRAEYAHNVQVVMRFINEAQIANSVSHPGIVKIFDHGFLPSGEAYLGMELLTGQSLRARMKRGCSEEEVVRWGRQISSALAAVHAVGIVHRDLKPDNLMLISDPDIPGGERIKVLDFGIARITRPQDFGDPVQLTSTGMLIGTPSYMAPEQCSNAKQSDAKTDVYALGVILYELLCGVPPFVARSEQQLGATALGSGVVEILFEHLHGKPAPISNTRPDVSPTLEALVHRLLSKSPAQRPSMCELMDELVVLATGSSTRVPLDQKPTLPAMKTPLSGAEQHVSVLPRSRTRTLRVTAALCGALAFVGVAIGEAWHRRAPLESAASTQLESAVTTIDTAPSPPVPIVTQYVPTEAPTITPPPIPSNPPSPSISHSLVKVQRGPIRARTTGGERFEALTAHEAANRLMDAQATYNRADYQTAFNAFKQLSASAGALSFNDAQLCWYLLGRSACRVSSVKDAVRAYRSLGDGNSAYARAAIASDCKARKLKCLPGETDDFCRLLAATAAPPLGPLPPTLRNPYNTSQDGR